MHPFCLRARAQRRFYNAPPMRPLLLTTLLLTCLSTSWAQSPAPAAAPVEGAQTTARTPVEKRVERIQIEDEGARIDELRIGGETKTITVQPKGGMPAYDVKPASGERSWKVFGF